MESVGRKGYRIKVRLERRKVLKRVNGLEEENIISVKD